MDGSGRWGGYLVFMTEWWNSGHQILGLGMGSFGVMSRSISLKHNFNTFEIWPWLHSDWLQTMFELGVVGFILYAVLFVSVSKDLYTKRSSLLFSIWMGLGASALIDFPIRYFPMAFIDCLVAVKSKRL